MDQWYKNTILNAKYTRAHTHAQTRAVSVNKIGHMKNMVLLLCGCCCRCRWVKVNEEILNRKAKKNNNKGIIPQPPHRQASFIHASYNKNNRNDHIHKGKVNRNIEYKNEERKIELDMVKMRI